MLNIGGGEFLVILLVALVILGPTKLPEAARQVGKVLGEFRRMSSGFQRELKDALDNPIERATGVRKDVVSSASPPPIPSGTDAESDSAIDVEPSLGPPSPDAPESSPGSSPSPGDPPDDGGQSPIHGDR